MTDMIERVAKALYERNFDGKRAEPSIEPQWSIYTADARAAIAAMRECTPEMLDAGSAAHPAGGYTRGTLLNDIIECEWRAMVDAALGEK